MGTVNLRHAKIFIILLLALILRLGVLDYNMQRQNYNIQQDGYANYARAISKKEVNSPVFMDSEKKLFPGYPILIYIANFAVNSPIASGIFIAIASSLGAICLFWVLTKSPILTSVFAFFPPMWVVQGSKVATEPLTVFLLLLSLFFYLRHRFFTAGLVLGFAFDVRTIAVALFIALLLDTLLTKSYRRAAFLSLGFALSSGMLFIYNFFIFQDLFYQFNTYSKTQTAIGLLQIVPDIIRAYNWEQYRILISGTLYLLANITGLFLLFRIRDKSRVHFISFYWLLFSLVFIFSAAPNPLLEDFARYSIPALPALFFLFYREKKQ